MSFVPYESIALHLFSQIQPLIFMTICAPIRKNILQICMALVKSVLVPLFFKAPRHVERNLQRSKKSASRKQALCLLLVIISSIFVLLSIVFAVLSVFEGHNLNSKHEQRSFQVESQQLPRLFNCESFKETLSIADNRFECFERRGYPNLQFEKCYTVLVSPYQNQTNIYWNHKKLCEYHGGEIYYPVTLEEGKAVDKILQYHTSLSKSPKVFVGYESGWSYKTYWVSEYRSYDGNVRLDLNSLLWMSKPRGEPSVCQENGKLYDCDKHMFADYLVCMRPL